MNDANRTLRFVFSGWFLDGSSIAPDHELHGRYSFLSDHGRVGATFRDIPPERNEEGQRLVQEFFDSRGDIDSPNDALFVELSKKLGSLTYQIYEVVGLEQHGEETLVQVRSLREDDPEPNQTPA